MGTLVLLQRIQERKASVAVVGLGYVGLPLAMAAAAAGFDVTGFDTEAHRVESLTRGESYVLDIDAAELGAQLAAGRFHPTTDPASLAEADVIVICVPTPLRNELPDMTYIEEAGKMIAAVLAPGRLVILESTTYPGTTEEYLRDILESSGLHCGVDFSLGFSPERIDPGNTRFAFADVPKIVGGIDADSTSLMKAFYSAFIDRMPAYVVERIGDCLNEEGKSLKGSKLLILGVAYKPDVSDVRESPALAIIARLRKSGAVVSFHDPHVASVELDDGPLDSIELDDQRLREADLVAGITNHSSYALDVGARPAPPI